MLFSSHSRLAAIALLVLEEEESAFWCLVAIVETIMPADYYSKTLTSSQVSRAGTDGTERPCRLVPLEWYLQASESSFKLVNLRRIRKLSGLHFSLCTRGQ